MTDGCARGWLTEKSGVNSAAGRELGKTTKRLLLKIQLEGGLGVDEETWEDRYSLSLFFYFLE